MRVRCSLAVLLLSSCGTPGGSTEPPTVLFRELGRFQRTVTTNSPEAQRYFDQGLLLCYGFNHEEAIRSFERAAELDPQCAMAYWGQAFAVGPNYNNEHMDEAANKAAFEAVSRARELAPRCTDVERELIGALARRYVWPAPEDRKQLDRDYAEAMRSVWAAHPDDADVGTLFAEAMMDLRPWDLWTPDGAAQPGTEDILLALASVLVRVPDHPGALHYTIHAWEMSPTPERGLPAADGLRQRVPGAGHLVHMPSHIDMRIGHYAEAIVANERAIAADLRYVQHAGRMNFYSFYRAHNYHMLVWAAMFAGQSQKALAAARELVRELPPELIEEHESVESFLSIQYDVLVRFGLWQEILAEPEPAADFRVTRMFWHFARAMAFSALRRIDDAARERAQFDRAAALVPEGATLSLTPIADLCAVARKLMDGELEYRRGNFERAFELLREGVALDDALHYDEPKGWMQPVRHALGALLLEQGRVAEAEAVYREDLARYPGNGWSLHGLAESLRRAGREAEATEVEAQFTKAWARADVKLAGSCYCRTGG